MGPVPYLWLASRAERRKESSVMWPRIESKRKVIAGNVLTIGLAVLLAGRVEALPVGWSARALMPNGGRSDVNAAVANGVLYVTDGNGGRGGNNTTIVEAYDPATDSWSSKAPKPSNQNSAAIGVINGTIYVAGGGTPGVTATTLAYDPASDTLSSKASMPTARVGLRGGVIDGILYAVGGK